jgi:predicted enzyme related to lactoylglutathione lyase
MFGMVSSVHNVSFDAVDAYGLAQFWSQVVGKPVHDVDKPGDPEVAVDMGDGSNLFFQQVPEGKTIKNRMHVCLRPDHGTRDEEVARLEGIGAKVFDDRRNPDGTGWVVMQDPEGNEFCVERSEAERAAAATAGE